MTELERLKAQRNEISRKINELEKAEKEMIIGGLKLENCMSLSINTRFYRAYYHNNHPELLEEKRYKRYYEILDAYNWDEFVELLDELIEDLEKVKEEITDDTD